MEALPTITALMPAHDAEAYVELALRSALEQDYPPELLDVVVVDDGSTDATAEVVARVAAASDGRVHLIRQENRGLVGAVNRAAEAATGELLALLDADDLWPADKLRRQVEVLRTRPEVGLVYTDMCVIDAAGEVLDPSWLAGCRPPQGREVGRLLEENRVTASSILLRGTLRDHLFPVPAELPWADWWLAVQTALVAEIAYLAEPSTGYRFHGANMSLGTEGAARLRELRGALRVQRFFLRRLTAEEVAVDELEHAWDAFGRMATEALAVAGSPFAALVEVTDDDRREAAALADDARRRLDAGDLLGARATAVRAAACDPSADAVRELLLEARARTPLSTGDPLRDARDTVVVVQAGELLRAPELLAACVEHLQGIPDLSVAIDASDADPEQAIREIGELIERAGLTDDDRIDLVLVTGPLAPLAQARLRHGVAARIAAAPAAAGQPGAPAFPPQRLAALRERLLARAAA
ncbi:MAG TPA: glycosyltransferase [Baekduia sp.]|nr:glycosyltransferase [Baekduia sp.]